VAYEDPNAPITDSVKKKSAVAEKKSGTWDWLWPALLAVVIVRLFGLVGGLVAFGSYYWLRPKLGTWGAVALAGVIGVAVAVGLLALLQ